MLMYRKQIPVQRVEWRIWLRTQCKANREVEPEHRLGLTP